MSKIVDAQMQASATHCEFGVCVASAVHHQAHSLAHHRIGAKRVQLIKFEVNAASKARKLLGFKNSFWIFQKRIAWSNIQSVQSTKYA